MHPDSEGAYEATASRCHASVAMAQKAKTFGEDMTGLYVSVRRRT